MTNYLFYFTGTGNTLDAAIQIEKRLDNVVLVDVVDYKDKSLVIDDSISIGFIFPVYVFRYPLIFDKFIMNLTVKKTEYIYSIADHGGAPFGATKIFKNLLARNGIKTNATFNLTSPDNYLESANPPNKEEASQILSNMYAELEQISTSIRQKEDIYPKIKLYQILMGSLISKSLPQYARKAPSKFFINNCTGCGICFKTCPQEIISLDNENKPTWSGTNCELCFACINLCPQNCIEYSINTKGKNRYKNPNISLSKLLRR